MIIGGMCDDSNETEESVRLNTAGNISRRNGDEIFEGRNKEATLTKTGEETLLQLVKQM